MKKIIFYSLILILATSLRFWHLSTQPPGLTWDEAAIGYNAYSILKTGKDEFGISFPLIFKSFGDYKPGLYVYLTVPSVAVFGLTEFSVRLPSALFGVIAVLTTGLLLELLTENQTLGLLASLALAISPWHVHFSRGGWESNIFVTFIILGTYFFYLSAKKGKVNFLPSLLLFTLSLLLYQSAKLYAPIILLLLIALNWKDFKSKVNPYIILVFLVIWGAFYFNTFTSSSSNRLARLSILGYKPKPSEQLIKIDSNSTSLAIFHSQADLTARLVASRYLYHLSPEFLFYSPPEPSPRENIFHMGMLYMFDFVWLVSGLIYLVKLKDTKTKILLISFLILGPLPASLTLSEFSPVRSLLLTFPLAVLISFGIYHLYKFNRLLFIILLAIYLHSVVLGLDLYFNHSHDFYAKGFNYGYKQAIDLIKKFHPDKVYFTDVYGQPYIYYLFYSKYDPATYQKNNQFVSNGVDVGKVDRVGNVEFHQTGKGDITSIKNSLFIDTRDNFPNNFNYNLEQIETHNQISYDNGDPIFRWVKTK